MKVWQEKCWGKTCLLYNAPCFQRHELCIESNGYCSVHYHSHRANRFHVRSGIVRVIEFYAWTFTDHVLTADMECTVPSLVPHMFQVVESGEMMEDYWNDRHAGAPIDTNDIQRLCQGGVKGPEESWEDVLNRILHEKALVWNAQ